MLELLQAGWVILVVVGVTLYIIIHTLYKYFSSVGGSVARIAKGGGEKAMAEMERAIAMADVVALAVLADGEARDAEVSALQEAFSRNGLPVRADESIKRARAVAGDVTHAETLRRSIERFAARLKEDERAEAFRVVVDLAGAGAGAIVGQTDYRHAKRWDPGALITIFAESMRIPPDTRAALTRGERTA